MAAQPEESAQSADVQDPELGHKDRTAAEMESSQGGDELPCPSNYSSWKECFHEKVQQRCLSLQETKMRLVQAQKAEEAKERRREPGDWLAREWYNEEKETLDTRIYLLDNLLPTLIPGAENLLMAVERNHVLVSDQEPTRFKPINYLGEYLMRHNPQYSVPTKPGPYLREMKVVSEELKSLRQGTASQRLAQMKAEAKNKHEEREEMERQKTEETARRKEVLAALFKEWTVDGHDRIPAALVQSTMRFFPDVTDSIPEDIRKATHDRKLKIINTLEKTVYLDEFTKLILSYTEHVSSDNFQEIMEYLHKCAEDFQEATKHDARRQIFIDLFQACDYGKVGVLDRQKILALLRDIYDRTPMSDEWELWNPREWPIIELQDINLMDFWGSLGDQEVCEELSENLVLSQTEISEGEILGNEPVDDDRQETERMSTSVSEGVVEEMGMSEAEIGGISKEENEAAEPSASEVSKEGEDAMSAVKSTGLEATDLDGEPGSGKPEESILGSEPETETKPEGDHTSAREPGSEGQVSQEDSGVTETAPEATSTASGDRAVTDTDVTDSQQDAPAAEAVKETSASNESQSDQQTSSETRLQDENLLHDQGKDSGPSVAEIQNCQDPCTKSFAASCLTLPQFVQLMDNFVGEDISLPTVKRLTAFIKGEYKQTEEEKIKQREKVHRMSHVAQRKQLLEALFEKWDSKACGSLDLEEVIAVLSTFKGHMGKEALMEAKEQLCSRYPQLSKVRKLSPKAFQIFLELIASKFTGNEDETIDSLVRFLTTSVEQSHTKSLQSSARRKWLQDIQKAAETSGTSMEPVYKAVIKALSQDMEAHGDNKRISAYIALLEENRLSPEQGQVLLRYVACTADDAPYILNQVLHRDMKGVSFAAIDQGKPIYVPRVQHHGNIHFWNSDRSVEERKGSLLVLPLYDVHWRVFGILGLDTLRDQCHKSIFLTHEITFYEGVCHAFSKAYHHVCMQENVLQVAVTALDWLYPRTPSIHAVTTYLVAPGKDKNYVLCKVITTDNTGQKEVHRSPVVLLREENLLRDYLFKCTDSSEVTLTSVYGEHHIAVPLHDLSRQTVGIFDISIGQHKKLPPQEQKDLQKMLKMAQAACSEILQRSLEEREPTQVLEAERVADVRHAGILFHRFMLQELRECVLKLSAESFARIKSCAEPPALVHDVVKAVLLLLHPDWKGSEETESWSQCKLKLDDNLIQEIYCFDPTASSVQVQGELLLDLITGVPQAAVWQQDSAPAQYLYQWLHTCLALVEITKSQHTEKTHP
ncbi:EF-hand calcium-binding domain-containing protein 5 [Vidua chalybeata]|nr:EF-hand calcium-binding domain-containing protein 5 [Vidua chalybeata]XP_053816822.1 EF-hand calcium-binding domain-containing protein 5 [Vidua chalybeata]XP_053816823.1 EF-hand calcium-binding domain-containing protein 5 [Vidua chalybeata]XP_053816824.1 EF-hand calcium-binding domain-containing protein 5 [Vidua chalybeata]XP_053816825.1 EF-hand calcium-binding domain-containing protein 5 [Vidua chalybeata]XP_053816826.1 EF-hand calcium-binding domain-containing protein 5 [Vidua chalybeata]